MIELCVKFSNQTLVELAKTCVGEHIYVTTKVFFKTYINMLTQCQSFKKLDS